MSEKQQAEELNTAGRETMRIKDKNSCHFVVRKMVLQEIELKDHRRDHEHSPLFIQQLPIFCTP